MLPLIPMADPWLALSTEAGQERAESLARAALEQGLAACVALRPVTSLYRWQGAIETAEEVQILFKTDAAHLEALAALVQGQHSYDCPQWLCWPASASAGYGAWLSAELNSALSPDGGPPAA